MQPITTCHMAAVATGYSQSAFVLFKSRISLHNRITFGFVKPIRKNATFEKISLFPLCDYLPEIGYRFAISYLAGCYR